MSNVKRKSISKELRELVWHKFGKHCAYCDCYLESIKDMQVDHFAPVYLFGDNIDIKNLYPACRSCNKYKDTFTIEKFREQLSKIPERLSRDVTTYNIAKRYGMIEEIKKPVRFFYENYVQIEDFDDLANKILSMEN